MCQFRPHAAQDKDMRVARNSVETLMRKCCESRTDFAAVAGVENVNSNPMPAVAASTSRNVVAVAGKAAPFASGTLL
jgi:hypothetical protein